MMQHKRKKQYFAYYLTKWKRHEHFEFDVNKLRINDWYKLIEIIKRGGMKWWESK